MELMVILGAGYFLPVKIMFALALLLSGLGMYFLAKEFFGKWGGVLAAVLYVYSPYHSVDIYVRGAMNEGWGMVWFPFVLLFIYRLILKDRNKKLNLVLISLALAMQLTSHNVMTMVFAPSAIVWALFWIWYSKNWKSIKDLIFAGLLGVGLSAFFFIPVVLEQKYVHVDSMIVGYFNYLAHFADLNQLFTSRFWGYGGSTWGPEDNMSFSIGQVQWITAFLGGLIALASLFIRRLSAAAKEKVASKSRIVETIVVMLVIFGLGYAFLTHSRSVYFWDRISILQFAQFPWRLVALIVFYFSFAGGYLATVNFPKFIKPLLFSGLILFTIVWNLPFFRVERHTRLTIEEKLSGFLWEMQVTGGIFDYLPRSAPKPPGDPAFTIPQYTEGTGGIMDYKSGSNWMSFTANVSTSSAKVMLPLYTYPGLVTKVDNRVVETEIDWELGRVIVYVPEGLHTVSAKIGYTTKRFLSELITLISVVVLIKLIIDARKHPA